MNQREADYKEKNEDGKKKEEKDSLTGILSDKMLLLRVKWNMMFSFQDDTNQQCFIMFN